MKKKKPSSDSKDQARTKLKQRMDKVGKRHHHIPEEEVEKDVLEAIKWARR
jgi:ribosome-binding protein aMBF1 (putative translation factor)